jgi:hypothetical protein
MKSLPAVTLALSALLVGAPAHAAEAKTAKIFSDKGSTYFRTDNKRALSVGAELDVSSDAAGEKPVGKIVVMEVNGALARISIDDDVSKAGGKFVVLPAGAHGASAAAAPSAPAGAGIIPDVSPIHPAHGAPLRGRLEQSGLRYSFSNDSDGSWTRCSLVHSDGSSYDVGEVVKHSDDTVMRVKLMGAWEPVYDHVNVHCAEGQGQFFFAKPSQPRGHLTGYATDDGKGSIVLYNQNETAWTACDVIKPNGTHYVLGTLKGHDSDSIDRGRFKKEAEAPVAKWVELRCQEGVLHASL